MTAITWLTENWPKVLAGSLLFAILPVMSVGLWLVSMCTTDYVCYLWANELPVMIPLIISGTMAFLYLYWIHACNCEMTLKVIEVVFSRFLKNRNPANGDEEVEDKLFIVLGYEASLKDMYWLFIILVQASLLAFAQFWDNFLLETSSSCSADSNIYCFYTIDLNTTDSMSNTTDSMLPYQGLNCSNTSQVEEATSIICYKYVFNTGQAAASAIGILSATGLIIYTVCVVFLKMLDGAEWHIGYIILAKVIAVLEVLSFCAVLGGLQVTHTNPASGVFGKINSFFKTLSMGFMIAGSVLFFPVDSFKKNTVQYERL